MINSIELLEKLDPDEIRTRLSELGREDKALRVLLRAAIRRQSPHSKPSDSQGGVPDERLP